MEVRSRAWRSDLGLLELSGSIVEHHPTYVVARTPANPAFYWGNFLLLKSSPSRRDMPHWLDVFAETFPEAKHVSIGVDDPTGRRADLQALADEGFEIEAATVLTTDEVHAPPHPNTSATIRFLESDDDWKQRVNLSLACYSEDPSGGGEEFTSRRAAAERRLVEGGAGAWLGAFEAGTMLSGLGIFRAGDQLARYQDVETHPAARGNGLAGTLVHAAAQHARDRLGARTMVIVADPDYHAIRIYRGVGFRDSETQLQALRSPSPGS
ncbi:MAG: GCN5-related N-acetyltransferase [Nocardioides sp.]|nr:GCN5-related N-acetyltransferase [Nocardioides sp.]